MKILIICSEPFDSAWAYLSLGIMKALRKTGCQIFFLYQQERTSSEYEQYIDSSVIRIPFALPKNKFLKQFAKMFPIHLLVKILKLHKKHQLVCAHSLSTGYLLKNIIPLLPESIPLIYTVHDAISHPTANKSLMLRYIRRLEQRVIRSQPNLATCSKMQLSYLRENFLDKRLFYFRMPSHISDTIIAGTAQCPEIVGNSGYILFFGSIALYKGLDVLVDAYHRSSISASIKLVIAGKGSYKIKNLSHPNIIFIHRHIKDCEVRNLFENAGCVVYPYTSITQTAVVQFPYYFQIPVIASDLDYFKSCIIDKKSGFLFENGNVQKLSEILEYVYSESFHLDEIKHAMAEQFEECYSEDGLQKELISIYKDIGGVSESSSNVEF